MKKSGFTLVELLAVIVILGLLSAMVVTSVITILNNSKKDAYELLILEIRNAAKDYTDEHREILAGITFSHPKYTIYLLKLIQDQLIKSPVKNPKSNKMLNEDVTTIVIEMQNDGSLTYSVTLVDK